MRGKPVADENVLDGLKSVLTGEFVGTMLVGGNGCRIPGTQLEAAVHRALWGQLHCYETARTVLVRALLLLHHFAVMLNT